MQPGDSVPVYDCNHAWNAVKIDGGEWKLIDACWGAGYTSDEQVWVTVFKPERFTQSNEEFGVDHFPGDNAHQFRRDGRVVSWEEYMRGSGDVCSAKIFSAEEEGLSKTSFRPAEGMIVLAQQGPTVRFSFQKVCPHWDPVRNGKGEWYLYVLVIEALKEEPKRGFVPFETNGSVWWCDVKTRELGRGGQKVNIYAMTQFDGRDGRGLRAGVFRERIGRCGWASSFVGEWVVG